MRKRMLNMLAITTMLATPALANDPEVVVEWNSLPYAVKDEATKSAWEGSEVFGRALVQGAKVDSQGNINVSTARWGGAEIPSTVSKLVKNDGTWGLEAFPSEEMNNISNPDGLKAVLGFEIDRNDVMWILDQGHVSNHLHIWVDGDMDFETPEIPNFRIWKIPGVGQSYTAE